MERNFCTDGVCSIHSSLYFINFRYMEDYSILFIVAFYVTSNAPTNILTRPDFFDNTLRFTVYSLS